MSQHRNLTSNQPRSNYEDEEYNHHSNQEDNPFINPIEEQSSDSFVSNHQSSSQSDEDQFQYGRPFNSTAAAISSSTGSGSNLKHSSASNYNGYYLNNSNNNTTSNLLANTSTANTPDSLNAINNNLLNNPNYANKNSTNIQVPSEYDRYPSINGSRVVSSTSLSSTFFANAGQAGGAASNLNSKSDTGSSVSNRSASNPFLNSADFSPFGGYPASSFPLHIDEKEPDDYLHNPDPIADAAYDKNRFIHDLRALDKRSLGGLLTFIGLFIAAMAIFVVLPVVTFTGVAHHYTPETYEILTHYSYPIMASIRTALVDPDTPEDALTKKTRSGDTWPLVFSDEFNAEGRTFYEGDDQFFYAPDFHYAATTDLEWYDPDACTTANGTLVLRMDAFKNHNLLYRSGMIHSWNKMCFTQGLIEISAKLPHYGNISGLWPGLWTMGNLGRAGYMASTEGVWPYTYDSCDSGITANQSSLDGISYLPGQKLNVCTCKGEDHPNRGTGRGAPEIDLIEGEVSTEVLVGIASQSMQIAPYDIWYYPNYDFVEIYNLSVTSMNSYTGGPYQQAVSAVTTLNNSWYERGGGEHHFQHYGYEYLNDDTDGYCTWYVGDEPTFTVYANALAPNGNIGWRRISKEPMSIVMNFGLSNNWAYINWPSLIFPSELRIDYVRVYQPSDQKSVTCEPDDYPTQDYINDHLNAYQNVNLTSWTDAGYTFPKNSLVNGC